MEEFLTQMMGKKVDVSCGTGATVRGDVVAVKAGVLYLRDEQERVAYIAVDSDRLCSRKIDKKIELPKQLDFFYEIFLICRSRQTSETDNSF